MFLFSQILLIVFLPFLELVCFDLLFSFQIYYSNTPYYVLFIFSFPNFSTGSIVGVLQLQSGLGSWKYSESPHSALQSLGFGAIYCWMFGHGIRSQHRMYKLKIIHFFLLGSMMWFWKFLML
ncbi:unnamed protein product [Cuscuta epithymum]|uniref:Uncharacterized protein n=1 Tax=Cuscuta epithymum TaxID=186058 RepID=A0AAV0ENN2_9ASTE|nr:unnamed protein product [Cuscuta epithymum]